MSATATRRRLTQDGRPFDTQRKRVYDAERAFWKATPRLETVAEMQAYVNRITRQKWWEKQTHRRNVVVLDGRSRRSGCCDLYAFGAELSMPRFARHEGYLLHELAHVLAPVREAWHGRGFTRAMLLLVQRYVGQAEFEALLASYREHGVEWEGALR